MSTATTRHQLAATTDRSKSLSLLNRRHSARASWMRSVSNSDAMPALTRRNDARIPREFPRVFPVEARERLARADMVGLTRSAPDRRFRWPRAVFPAGGGVEDSNLCSFPHPVYVLVVPTVEHVSNSRHGVQPVPMPSAAPATGHLQHRLDGAGVEITPPSGNSHRRAHGPATGQTSHRTQRCPPSSPARTVSSGYRTRRGSQAANSRAVAPLFAATASTAIASVALRTAIMHTSL